MSIIVFIWYVDIFVNQSLSFEVFFFIWKNAIMEILERGDMMRLEELINRNYDHLNDNDLYIWQYISAHRKECEKLSIDDLASRCHVSRTTIMRFAQRLGLKGYTELKVYLRIDNQKYQQKQTGLDLVYHTYHKYMDIVKEKDLTNVIELIDQSENAYVYGTGSIQNNVAAEIKRSFLEVGKLFFSIRSMNETYAFESMMTSHDVIIMISYSGKNKQLLEFAKKLKTKSVPIIAITATKDNTLSHIATESFYVDVPNILNPIGPRHEGLVNYFILIDFILVKYIDYHERKLSHDIRRTREFSL